VDRDLRRHGRGCDDGFSSRGGASLEIIHRRGSADEEMSTGDEKVERAADKLQAIAERMASESGIKSKLAQPLADDAELLRKMKPSLIKARARGEAPTNQRPAADSVAPSGPQLGKRPPAKPARRKGGGPNPWLVAGAALAVGILLAKVIDWRGHAHPRA
jgi:hypothetical protein